MLLFLIDDPANAEKEGISGKIISGIMNEISFILFIMQWIKAFRDDFRIRVTPATKMQALASF
ncbi:hypothetical protein KCP73_15415 [Salmonella enterica subsp. enterica]|nr:hypothetical protein KCP73_15415 [Salmonella enterica subsp. enterica]